MRTFGDCPAPLANEAGSKAATIEEKNCLPLGLQILFDRTVQGQTEERISARTWAELRKIDEFHHG